jgi:hypothetical protein
MYNLLSLLMVWAIMLAARGLRLFLFCFAAAFLELIKADHEPFRTTGFQSCGATIISSHI